MNGDSCDMPDDPERAAERSATVGGFLGSVLGAGGGPVGAGIGGLVGGSTGYVLGYAAAQKEHDGHDHSDTDPVSVPVEDENGDDHESPDGDTGGADDDHEGSDDA